MYQNANDNFEKTINIGRDVGIYNAIYRIDWTFHFVNFYLNGEFLIGFTSAEVTIPNEPLNIKMGVIPEVPVMKKYDPGYWNDVGDHVDLSMQIFRVRYIRWADSKDLEMHEELFVLDDSTTSMRLQIFILIATIFGLVIIIYLMRLCKNHFQVSGEYYTLMEDSGLPPQSIMSHIMISRH